MTYEEALLVIISINEPAGYSLSAVAAYLACIWMEDVNAVYLDLNLSAFSVQNIYIRFTKDYEQVSLAGVLKVIGHVQVCIHARLEYRDASEFVKFRRVSVVVKSAGNQYIETCIAGLAGGGHQIGAGDCAEFGADEDSGALFAARFFITSFGADQIAWPRSE